MEKRRDSYRAILDMSPCYRRRRRNVDVHKQRCVCASYSPSHGYISVLKTDEKQKKNRFKIYEHTKFYLFIFFVKFGYLTNRKIALKKNYFKGTVERQIILFSSLESISVFHGMLILI